MDVEYRYTKHQVARGARADAVQRDVLYLIKCTSSLRLTYQIRLLAYRALQSQGNLIIHVLPHCKLDPRLRDFQRAYSKLVRIERD